MITVRIVYGTNYSYFNSIDNFLLSSVIVQEERFQQDEKVRRETRRIQALSMGKSVRPVIGVVIDIHAFQVLFNFAIIDQ